MCSGEQILPQRPPFVFVDEIKISPEGEILGKITWGRDFIFSQNGIAGQRAAPAVFLLEALVQCGGAGLVLTHPQAGDSLWVLAAVRCMEVYQEAVLPAAFVLRVTNLKIMENLCKQGGEVRCDGKDILRASWSVVRR